MTMHHATTEVVRRTAPRGGPDRRETMRTLSIACLMAAALTGCAGGDNVAGDRFGGGGSGGDDP